MKHEHSHFEVTWEPRVPDFDSERLFVSHEKAFVVSRLKRIKEQPLWTTLLDPLFGEPEMRHWEQYYQALDEYSERLDRHQDEIASGVVPVKFFVENTASTKTTSIKIRLWVEHGTIQPGVKPPERPLRADHGPTHVPDWKPATGVPKIGGFARSGIKVGPHTIEVVFSELDQHDSADVLNEVLYIEGGDDTRFFYEIDAKQLKEPQRGEIPM